MRSFEAHRQRSVTAFQQARRQSLAAPSAAVGEERNARAAAEKHLMHLVKPPARNLCC